MANANVFPAFSMLQLSLTKATTLSDAMPDSSPPLFIKIMESYSQVTLSGNACPKVSCNRCVLNLFLQKVVYSLLDRSILLLSEVRVRW